MEGPHGSMAAKDIHCCGVELHVREDRNEHSDCENEFATRIVAVEQAKVFQLFNQRFVSPHIRTGSHVELRQNCGVVSRCTITVVYIRGVVVLRGVVDGCPVGSRHRLEARL